ncbi:MAG: CUAEP/CCAEP-tail radical SAM (seleno)protein [Acidobacteriota bacterium]
MRLPAWIDTPRPLRAPGAILLISCYELGHQPLSIASPAALLRRAGYAPEAIDLAVDRLRPEAVAAARLVAVAVPMHTALRLGSRVADRIRAINPACHLCYYGLYASLNAATLLERGADSIVGGEYEEPLLRLAGRLDRGGTGPIPGVRVRGADEPPWIRRIRFEVPYRGLLRPLDRYARLEQDGATRIAGHLEASRGCLHGCRHCPIPPVYGGRLFVVPREVVLADARGQVAAGATHITIGDPDFLNGPGHSMAILRRLHDEFPRLTFDFTAKVAHLLRYRGLLPEMARLGCLFVVSAVESLSDRVLAILDKGHTRADVELALALTRDAGLALRPSLVPFTPWTTLEDHRDLLDFVERRDLIDHLDPVQLSIRLLLPPGSLLNDRPEVRPFLGPLDAGRHTFLWTHPDARVDRLQEDVAAIVERAARAREDPRLTFLRIRSATARAGGESPAPSPDALLHPPPRRDRGRPPRLSEPWFC